MRSFLLPFCLVMLLCGYAISAVSQSTAKAEQADSDNPLLSAIDSLVESTVRPYIQQSHTAGLSVAVIRKDAVYRYNYGEVRKGNGMLPDPASTIYEIGSISKTFTALLLAREVIDGRMRLDDPVSGYLPDSIPDLHYEGNAVTLQHLSNHTSGLPRLPDDFFSGMINFADPYLHYDDARLYGFLMYYKPSVIPGTHYAYSNYGGGLLGNLLARRANRTYEELIVDIICRPLGMNHTRITLTKADSAGIAQGYNEKGLPASPWHFPSMPGTGAIRSTLNDMISYALAQMGRHAGSLEAAILLTQQTTFQQGDLALGLGWHIGGTEDSRYWHHTGGTGGFRSFLAFDKNRDMGVVILSNSTEDVSGMGVRLLKDAFRYF
ncbi:serine hydrolase [Chitinophaga sp. XS-30]|uniref:serine hydrolase domain-containing protein n=1 Tax=Chitinophaga sp. XS-30 TaxID=2604421 RepID=UPI0011DCE497|nr:serine hydrolase [Chitinophaga sp. XS-30]QEH41988.1 serine hydrolase [Chitinophaga sp. XS-30]